MKSSFIVALVILAMMTFRGAVAAGGYGIEWELPGTANFIEQTNVYLQDSSSYDCDDNGILEIVVNDNSSWPDSFVLTAYDGQSHQPVWNYSSNFEPHYLGAYDFDGDGIREIVIREYDYQQDDNYIKIIHWATGGLELTIHDVSNPVTYDVDGDSRPEMIIESGGGIQVWGFQTGVSAVDDHAASGWMAGALGGNFPNPFNPRTTIRFDLPTAGPVHLAIYDLAGRLVRVLVEGEMVAGSHEAVWDGRDQSGRSAPSGSYLARLVAGGKVEGVRLSLVR